MQIECSFLDPDCWLTTVYCYGDKETEQMDWKMCESYKRSSENNEVLFLITLFRRKGIISFMISEHWTMLPKGDHRDIRIEGYFQESTKTLINERSLLTRLHRCHSFDSDFCWGTCPCLPRMVCNKKVAQVIFQVGLFVLSEMLWSCERFWWHPHSVSPSMFYHF